jgi:hypothetical protein
MTLAKCRGCGSTPKYGEQRRVRAMFCADLMVDDESETMAVIQCRCGWQGARKTTAEDAAAAWNAVMAGST